MKKEIELKLVEKYPILYKDYGGDPRKTCMTWGFACGNGWHKIIEDLSFEITKIAKKHNNIEIVADQIKEKFGELRFYYHIDKKRVSIISYLAWKIKIFFIKNRLGRLYTFITNVRKKFYKTPIEKIAELVRNAELLSSQTCENCGNHGTIHNIDGWLKTLCDKCRENRK